MPISKMYAKQPDPPSGLILCVDRSANDNVLFYNSCMPLYNLRLAVSPYLHGETKLESMPFIILLSVLSLQCRTAVKIFSYKVL